MPRNRPAETSAAPSRRSLPLAVGAVLFDLKGHAYRVVSFEETAELDEGDEITLLRVQPLDERASHVQGLTRRQRQIAQLLSTRATNAEIAAALGISVHTARHHSQKVLEKLGISSRAQVRARYGRTIGEHESPGRARRDHS